MLSLRASPHFGTGHYQLLTVRDNHIVSGKHYGIAVDTSISCTCENILYAFIDTLSAEDKITVVTFGTHSEKRTFNAIDPGIKQHVADMLRTYQTGSNLMVGLSELEGDEYILISDGLFNGDPVLKSFASASAHLPQQSDISRHARHCPFDGRSVRDTRTYQRGSQHSENHPPDTSETRSDLL